MQPDRPDIVVLPPVLVGGALLFGVLWELVWPTPILAAIPARASGATLFLLSGLLAHCAQVAMRKAGTNILPTQPALVLVTSGPFRYTRNPLYLAAIGVYLGVSLWLGGVAPFVLALPMIVALHYGIVRREERYLEQKFGENYRTYRQRVRRWL